MAALGNFEAVLDGLVGSSAAAKRPKRLAIEIAAVRSQADSLRIELLEYEQGDCVDT